MKLISHEDLIGILARSTGARPVGILALTDADAKKTGNPFPGKVILKQVRAVGFVGADYQNAVRNEVARTESTGATFQAAPLPWGKWLIQNKVIEHIDKATGNPCFYLRTQTTPGMRSRQPARVICYRDNSGKFLSPDEVKPFLPAPTVSRKQANAGLESKSGMTDDDNAPRQVWVRTYRFDSIQRIRVDGQTYALASKA